MASRPVRRFCDPFRSVSANPALFGARRPRNGGCHLLPFMEIRDGFIVGIYNYCDAWCDRCPFTSRCRLFADKCRMEATLDPNLEPVATAPEHPSDAPPPPPQWLQELLDEIEEEAARTPRGGEAETYLRRQLRPVPDGDAIDSRAESYSRRARAWLAAQDFDWSPGTGDPRAVIEWFHMMIHVKAMRALRGLAEDDPAERGWPPDHDGSAKVALIGIDRSHTAWLDLVSVDFASASEVASFLEDLVWLRAALERTFPRARAFVRAAFDEPEEVARLLQGEI